MDAKSAALKARLIDHMRSLGISKDEEETASKKLDHIMTISTPDVRKKVVDSMIETMNKSALSGALGPQAKATVEAQGGRARTPGASGPGGSSSPPNPFSPASLPECYTTPFLKRNLLGLADHLRRTRPTDDSMHFVMTTSIDADSMGHPARPLRDLTRITLLQMSRQGVQMWYPGFHFPCVIAEDPRKTNAMQTYVNEPRDASIGVRVAIYNVQLQSSIDEDESASLFPKGLNLTLKEPYLKLSGDGFPSVRIDDPGRICVLLNAVSLDMTDTVAALGFTDRHRAAALHLAARGVEVLVDIHKGGVEFGDSGAVIRARGNEYFKLGRYIEAAALYREAVKRAPEDCLGWSNLSQAMILIQDPYSALLAAEAALKIDPDHAKSHLRRANALLACLQYRDAAEAYRTALAKDPASESVIAPRLADAVRLEAQRIRAEYPWAELALERDAEPEAASASGSKGKGKKGDGGTKAGRRFYTGPLSEYMGPIELAEVSLGTSKGWGFKATRDIEAGELLLFSVPLAYARTPDNVMGFMSNMNTMRADTIDRGDLLGLTLQRCRRDPADVAAVRMLQGGKGKAFARPPKVPSSAQALTREGLRTATLAKLRASPLSLSDADPIIPLPPGAATLTAADVKAKIDSNCFGSGSNVCILNGAMSYFNHSCCPNALNYALNGTASAVRAIRPIPKGSEVTISCATFSALTPLYGRLNTELSLLFDKEKRKAKEVAQNQQGAGAKNDSLEPPEKVLATGWGINQCACAECRVKRAVGGLYPDLAKFNQRVLQEGGRWCKEWAAAAHGLTSAGGRAGGTRRALEQLNKAEEAVGKLIKEAEALEAKIDPQRVAKEAGLLPAAQPPSDNPKPEAAAASLALASAAVSAFTSAPLRLAAATLSNLAGPGSIWDAPEDTAPSFQAQRLLGKARMLSKLYDSLLHIGHPDARRSILDLWHHAALRGAALLPAAQAEYGANLSSRAALEGLDAAIELRALLGEAMQRGSELEKATAWPPTVGAGAAQGRG